MPPQDGCDNHDGLTPTTIPTFYRVWEYELTILSNEKKLGFPIINYLLREEILEMMVRRDYLLSVS